MEGLSDPHVPADASPAAERLLVACRSIGSVVASKSALVRQGLGVRVRVRGEW